ncbi:hypothetical protein [Haladaptatus sp. DJG-WS-42]
MGVFTLLSALRPTHRRADLSVALYCCAFDADEPVGTETQPDATNAS